MRAPPIIQFKTGVCGLPASPAGWGRVSQSAFATRDALRIAAQGAAYMQFLYMGFSQNANVRSFRFQGVVSRERPSKMVKNLEFQLTADMALLAQHRIRVQDAPTLCLQILGAAFTSAEDQAVQFASYAITREDVSAFASARTALEETKAARRKHRPPFKPSPSSQLKWPQMK